MSSDHGVAFLLPPFLLPHTMCNSVYQGYQEYLLNSIFIAHEGHVHFGLPAIPDVNSSIYRLPTGSFPDIM